MGSGAGECGEPLGKPAYSVWDMAADTLTLAEAAARLGVNPKTIRRQIAAGNLRAYRLGTRAIRLRPADVDALLRPLVSVRAEHPRGLGRGALRDTAPRVAQP